jgi:lipopolysaccharide/colanic/teichoic acid biosynthesis glycosyltransferase
VIKRVAFGFRTFRHLRMRILIQQNLCDIIWAKKNKKKKGNAEAFPFSDLMRTTRFDLEPNFFNQIGQ